MSTNTGRLKLRLRIFNVILIALSTFSIVWFSIRPFVEVKADYLLTAETIKEVIKDINEEEVDIDDIVGDGIKIGLNVSITPNMLIKSFTTTDAKQFVKEDVIAPTVDSILEQVMPTIEEIAKRTVKSTAKKQLTNYLQDSFNEAFGEENVDVKAKLNEAGINVDQVVDTVFDAFMAENAVFSSTDPENPGVIQILLKQVNEVGASAYAYFKEEGTISEDWDKIVLTEDEINDIQQKFVDFGVVREDGTILDFDEMLAVLIDKATGSASTTTSSEHTAEHTSIIDPLNRAYAEEELTEEEQQEAAEEAESLAEKVKNLIYEKLPDGIEQPISIGLKAAGGVLGLFILTWGFVAIFALLKTLLARNPGIFTGLICFISALLQLILGLVLTFGSKVLLEGKLNSISVIGDLVSKVPTGLSVTIMTSAMIPAFCLLAKFVLTWFYHPTKRRLKKRLDLE